MRNKILIVDADAKDKEQLELILQEFVEEGGELFFADKREDGVAILIKEHPSLVFLDAALAGDKNDWVNEGVQIIFTCRKTEPKNEKSITKPFKRHQVLEKCRSVLHHEPVARIPPM